MRTADDGGSVYGCSQEVFSDDDTYVSGAEIAEDRTED